MTDKQKILYYYLQESASALKIIFEKYGLEVNSEKLWQILIEYYGCYDIPTEILLKKLDSNEILKIITINYLPCLSPLLTIQIDYTVIPESVFNDNIIKGIIKYKGEIWEIHKNDWDEFPSNPHAHNYEYGLKLHLGTGELYQKRRFMERIKKKDLLRIRALIQNNMKTLDLPII